MNWTGASSRRTLMSFGKYPDVSLALVRERHGEARKLMALWTDPMAQRKAEKAATENLFRSIAALWLEHWQEWEKPATCGLCKTAHGWRYFALAGHAPLLRRSKRLRRWRWPKPLSDAAHAILPNAHWKPRGKSFASASPMDVQSAIQRVKSARPTF
jgi:hypothetical protein